MRLSTKHWLGRLAALALCVGFLIAAASPVASAGLAIEVPHVIGLKVEPPPLHIETPSLPTVEVPGVLKVETTSTSTGSTSPSEPIAKGEATTTTPIATTTEASVPPTTTGASGAPVSQSPTRTSTPPAASTASSQANAATAASGASTSAATTGAASADAIQATRSHDAKARGSRGTSARKAAKRHPAGSGGGATPGRFARGS